MCREVAIVANNSHPGFLAALTTILKWPDRSQAYGYAVGMRISEDIEETGVFRELQHKEVESAKVGTPYLAARQYMRSKSS